MRNVFEDLGKERAVDFEEYTGAFSCQEKGCYEVATTAKFITKEKLLTWECANGHFSKVEDFNG